MRSGVVTGASTGIGWATAKLLLTRGFRVFGSVRKAADAERLRNELGLTPWRCDRIYGAFPGRQVMSGGARAVERSAARYIELLRVGNHNRAPGP